MNFSLPDDELYDMSQFNENIDNVSRVVNIGLLNDYTSLGCLKLVNDTYSIIGEDYTFEYQFEEDAKELAEMLISEKIDICVLPLNLALELYDSTNKEVTLLNQFTSGGLYITETGTSVNELSDLNGKTIYMSQKDSYSDLVLRNLLVTNNINATILYRDTFSTCYSEILNDGDALAALPHDYISIAINGASGARIAVDVFKEWKNATELQCVDCVSVASKSFVYNNPFAVKEYFERLDDSISFAIDNPNEISLLATEYLNAGEEAPSEYIKYSGFSFVHGDIFKSNLMKYLGFLGQYNAKAVVDEDFCFVSY